MKTLRLDWTIYIIVKDYSPEQLLGRLNTYSGAISLRDDMRKHFLDDINAVILNSGGSVERIFELVLLVVEKE